MADSDDTKAEASAEKAYAAATEAVTGKGAAGTPESGADADPVEFPAKAKRTRKPRAEDATPAAEASATDLPVAPEPVAKAAPVPKDVSPLAPRRARVVAKPAKAAARPAVKRAVAKPAAKIRMPAAPKIKAAPEAAKPPETAKHIVTQPAISNAPKSPLTAQLKEIPMETTSNFKDTVDGAQEKAKDAFAKTSATVGEYGEFAKGNVEAFVESGKILASGLQDMGSKFLADSKAAFETTVADVKELSGVKTPADFLKLQTEVMRRNFDNAVAYGSKTSEAMLKLTNDVFAPISGRVSLAVEKLRKAA